MFLCCPALGTSRVAWLVWFLLLALTSISQPRWQKQKHRRGFLSSELPAAIQAYLSSSFSITHERFPLENSCVVSPEISIIINNNNNKKKTFSKTLGVVAAWSFLSHARQTMKAWRSCHNSRLLWQKAGDVWNRCCVCREKRKGGGRENSERRGQTDSLLMISPMSEPGHLVTQTSHPLRTKLQVKLMD